MGVKVTVRKLGPFWYTLRGNWVWLFISWDLARKGALELYELNKYADTEVDKLIKKRQNRGCRV